MIFHSNSLLWFFKFIIFSIFFISSSLFRLSLNAWRLTTTGKLTAVYNHSMPAYRKTALGGNENLFIVASPVIKPRHLHNWIKSI